MIHAMAVILTNAATAGVIAFATALKAWTDKRPARNERFGGKVAEEV
jgi:hypothetical protein